MLELRVHTDAERRRTDHLWRFLKAAAPAALPAPRAAVCARRFRKRDDGERSGTAAIRIHARVADAFISRADVHRRAV
jgi:hypothetical protein